eukprot:m51a1_g13702 hypothetical protein (2932) ;mRNA; f:54328-72108
MEPQSALNPATGGDASPAPESAPLARLPNGLRDPEPHAAVLRDSVRVLQHLMAKHREDCATILRVLGRELSFNDTPENAGLIATAKYAVARFEESRLVIESEVASMSTVSLPAVPWIANLKLAGGLNAALMSHDSKTVMFGLEAVEYDFWSDQGVPQEFTPEKRAFRDAYRALHCCIDLPAHLAALIDMQISAMRHAMNTVKLESEIGRQQPPRDLVVEKLLETASEERSALQKMQEGRNDVDSVLNAIAARTLLLSTDLRCSPLSHPLGNIKHFIMNSMVSLVLHTKDELGLCARLPYEYERLAWYQGRFCFVIEKSPNSDTPKTWRFQKKIRLGVTNVWKLHYRDCPLKEGDLDQRFELSKTTHCYPVQHASLGIDLVKLVEFERALYGEHSVPLMARKLLGALICNCPGQLVTEDGRVGPVDHARLDSTLKEANQANFRAISSCTEAPILLSLLKQFIKLLLKAAPERLIAERKAFSNINPSGQDLLRQVIVLLANYATNLRVTSMDPRTGSTHFAKITYAVKNLGFKEDVTAMAITEMAVCFWELFEASDAPLAPEPSITEFVTFRRKLLGHTRPAGCLALTMDKHHLWSVDCMGEVLVWDAVRCRQEAIFSIPDWDKDRSPMLLACIGGRMWCSTQDGITILDCDTNTPVDMIPKVRTISCTLVASRNEVWCGSDGCVLVLKQEGPPKAPGAGPSWRVATSLVPTGEDSKTLFIAMCTAFNGSIFVWDMVDGKYANVAVVTTSVKKISTLSSVGEHVWMTSDEGVIQVMDARSHTVVRSIATHAGDGAAVCMLDGQVWLSSSGNTIGVWDPESFECIGSIVGCHQDMVNCMAVVRTEPSAGHSEVWVSSYDRSHASLGIDLVKLVEFERALYGEHSVPLMARKLLGALICNCPGQLVEADQANFRAISSCTEAPILMSLLKQFIKLLRLVRVLQHLMAKHREDCVTILRVLGRELSSNVTPENSGLIETAKHAVARLEEPRRVVESGIASMCRAPLPAVPWIANMKLAGGLDAMLLTHDAQAVMSGLEAIEDDFWSVSGHAPEFSPEKREIRDAYRALHCCIDLPAHLVALIDMQISAMRHAMNTVKLESEIDRQQPPRDLVVEKLLETASEARSALQERIKQLGCVQAIAARTLLLSTDCRCSPIQPPLGKIRHGVMNAIVSLVLHTKEELGLCARLPVLVFRLQQDDNSVAVLMPQTPQEGQYEYKLLAWYPGNVCFGIEKSLNTGTHKTWRFSNEIRLGAKVQHASIGMDLDKLLAIERGLYGEHSVPLMARKLLGALIHNCPGQLVTEGGPTGSVDHARVERMLKEADQANFRAISSCTEERILLFLLKFFFVTLQFSDAQFLSQVINLIANYATNLRVTSVDLRTDRTNISKITDVVKILGFIDDVTAIAITEMAVCFWELFEAPDAPLAPKLHITEFVTFRRKLLGHTRPAGCLALTVDKHHLWSVDCMGEVLVWDAVRCRLETMFSIPDWGKDRSPLFLACLGGRMWCSTQDGITILDCDTNTPVDVVRAISCTLVASRNEVWCGSDGCVLVLKQEGPPKAPGAGPSWRVATSLVPTGEDSKTLFIAMCTAFDGPSMAPCGLQIFVWDMVDGKYANVAVVTTSVKKISTLSSVGEHVWMTSDEGVIQVMDARSHTVVRSIATHAGDGAAVCVLDDQVWLSSSGNTIGVWDPESFECIGSIVGCHQDMVNCMAVVRTEPSAGHSEVWVSSYDRSHVYGLLLDAEKHYIEDCSAVYKAISRAPCKHPDAKAAVQFVKRAMEDARRRTSALEESGEGPPRTAWVSGLSESLEAMDAFGLLAAVKHGYKALRFCVGYRPRLAAIIRLQVDALGVAVRTDSLEAEIRGREPVRDAAVPAQVYNALSIASMLDGGLSEGERLKLLRAVEMCDLLMEQRQQAMQSKVAALAPFKIPPPSSTDEPSISLGELLEVEQVLYGVQTVPFIARKLLSKLVTDCLIQHELQVITVPASEREELSRQVIQESFQGQFSAIDACNSAPHLMSVLGLFLQSLPVPMYIAMLANFAANTHMNGTGNAQIHNAAVGFVTFRRKLLCSTRPARFLAPTADRTGMWSIDDTGEVVVWDAVRCRLEAMFSIPDWGTDRKPLFLACIKEQMWYSERSGIAYTVVDSRSEVWVSSEGSVAVIKQTGPSCCVQDLLVPSGADPSAQLSFPSVCTAFNDRVWCGSHQQDSNSQKVFVWDLVDGKYVNAAIIATSVKKISTLSSVGEHVWMTSDEGVIQVMDARSHTVIRSIATHAGDGAAVCVLDDQVWLSSSGNTIGVWDPESFECIGSIVGCHQDAVNIISELRSKSALFSDVWVSSNDGLVGAECPGCPQLPEDAQTPSAPVVQTPTALNTPLPAGLRSTELHSAVMRDVAGLLLAVEKAHLDSLQVICQALVSEPREPSEDAGKALSLAISAQESARGRVGLLEASIGAAPPETPWVATLFEEQPSGAFAEMVLRGLARIEETCNGACDAPQSQDLLAGVTLAYRALGSCIDFQGHAAAIIDLQIEAMKVAVSAARVEATIRGQEPNVWDYLFSSCTLRGCDVDSISNNGLPKNYPTQYCMFGNSLEEILDFEQMFYGVQRVPFIARKLFNKLITDCLSQRDGQFTTIDAFKTAPYLMSALRLFLQWLPDDFISLRVQRAFDEADRAATVQEKRAAQVAAFNALQPANRALLRRYIAVLANFVSNSHVNAICYADVCNASRGLIVDAESTVCAIADMAMDYWGFFEAPDAPLAPDLHPTEFVTFRRKLLCSSMSPWELAAARGGAEVWSISHGREVIVLEAIFVWDMVDGKYVNAAIIATSVKKISTLSRVGEHVWMTSDEGVIQVMDARSHTVIRTIATHAGDGAAVCVLDDQVWLSSSGNTIGVWDPESFECIGTIVGCHKGRTRCMIVVDTGPSGQSNVWVSSDDNSLSVWSRTLK